MWFLLFKKCPILGCGHLPFLLEILNWPGLGWLNLTAFAVACKMLHIWYGNYPGSVTLHPDMPFLLVSGFWTVTPPFMLQKNSLFLWTSLRIHQKCVLLHSSDLDHKLHQVNSIYYCADHTTIMPSFPFIFKGIVFY